MKEVSINDKIKLSEHFTLKEVCKTKHETADGNIPSHVAIENLTRICRDWLEDLRYSYNMLYGEEPAAATREGQAPLCSASSAQDGASPCVSPFEQRGSVCWLHFAVRPKENRRRISFDIK